MNTGGGIYRIWDGKETMGQGGGKLSWITISQLGEPKTETVIWANFKRDTVISSLYTLIRVWETYGIFSQSGVCYWDLEDRLFLDLRTRDLLEFTVKQQKLMGILRKAQWIKRLSRNSLAWWIYALASYTSLFSQLYANSHFCSAFFLLWLTSSLFWFITENSLLIGA